MYNEEQRTDYYANKSKYTESFPCFELSFSTEDVDLAVQKIPANCSPGLDNISIEHLRLAHPSVIIILKSIFNLCLRTGFLPKFFGSGVVTPIPKFKGIKSSVIADDFRGITLNVIPSKIFEHCLSLYLSGLPSSPRQFGFKKGFSCTHAISEVKNTVNFFNKRGCTVSIGLIDIRKAFDQASFWGILLLLQRKQIHPSVIELIEHWFLNSTAQVKWNDSISFPVVISAGVRQGGVLSPLLFSAYIDVVLDILEESNLGCFINRRCLNSFLYADDLILISPSVHDLQSLLSLASVSFFDLGLQINPSKSCCLRIGNRCMVTCQNINVNGISIPWVSEARYLGVVINRNKSFICNWSDSRGSYYRAVNSILGSLGKNPPIDVILKLIKSSCLPILTYGIPALSLSKCEIKSFSYAYNCVFSKLFKVFNVGIIEQCQMFCNFLPFYAYYDYLRFGFLSDKFNRGLLSPGSQMDDCDYSDFILLCLKYNLCSTFSKSHVKYLIWNFVESTVLI